MSENADNTDSDAENSNSRVPERFQSEGYTIGTGGDTGVVTAVDFTNETVTRSGELFIP